MTIRNLFGHNKASNKDDAQARVFAALAPFALDTVYDSEAVAKTIVSTESADQNPEILNTVYADALQVLQGIDGIASFEGYQKEAAIAGMMISARPQLFANSKLRTPGDFTSTFGNGALDGPSKRQFSAESYNEKDIRKFQQATAMFNLYSALQDEFNLAFFKPVNIPSTDSGVIIPITKTLIYNDYRHATDGSLAITGRVDAVRGFVNHKILDNRLLDLIPVVRTTGTKPSTENFVDAALVPVKNVPLGGGQSVNTAPLVFNKPINLIGISQTNRTVNSGMASYTTTISDALSLRSVHMQLGTDVYEVSTLNLPGFRFNPGFQGDTRRMDINLDTKSATIPAETLTIAGVQPADDVLFNHNLLLGFFVNGNCHLDTGETRLNSSEIVLINATTKDGEVVDEATFAEIEAIIKAGSLLGYTLDASAENLDLRQNGLLVEEKTYNVLITVPYRMVVSAVSSTYDGEENFEASLNKLINLQHMNSNGIGVETLLEASKTIANYKAIPNKDGNYPELEMIGARASILPTHYAETISAVKLVDGTRSGNRREDIKAGLLNYFHDVAIGLIKRSEFIPVVKSLHGVDKVKPTVIIGTDITIHTYLTGEFGENIKREEYDIVFAKTENDLMVGKVLMQISDNRDVSGFNPARSGYYLHSPELVSQMPKSVDGQKSNYLAVTPRYRHEVFVPVMAEIDITDVAELARKLTIYTQEQK